MDNKKQQISSMQLMAFTVSGQIGVGGLFLPSTLAQKVGHDGWLSTIFAGIICTIIAIIITLLLKKYYDKNIFDINILFYGKFLGNLINLIFIFYLVFICGITIRIFEEVINIILLRFTPPMVITTLCLVPIVYATTKGLKVICRFAVLVYIAYFLLIISFLFHRHNIRLTYLMPVGQAGLGTIFSNMKLAIYSYLGFELVALIYPNVTDKEKVLKCMVRAMMFTTFIYTFIVAFSVTLFGEVKLRMLVFPVYNIEQAISVPVIERLDTFFLLMWFPAMGSTITAYFFSTYHSISILFNIQKNKILLLIVTVIEIIISRIPPNFESINRYSFYSSICGLCIVATIIITFFISLFRQKDVTLS